MTFDNLRWLRGKPPRDPFIDDLDQIERENIKRFKLPPDLEARLEDAMNDFSGEKREPTAKQLAETIANLNRELAGARELVAVSEARVADLEAQLAKRLDVEIAELEILRPKTGEPHETSSDDKRLLAGPAGNVPDGGGADLPDAAGGPQGEPDSAPAVSTGHA